MAIMASGDVLIAGDLSVEIRGGGAVVRPKAIGAAAPVAGGVPLHEARRRFEREFPEFRLDPDAEEAAREHLAKMPAWAVRSPIAGLIQVCDVFEALTAARPYKNPMPPRRAFEIILKDHQAFDPAPGPATTMSVLAETEPLVKL